MEGRAFHFTTKDRDLSRRTFERYHRTAVGKEQVLSSKEPPRRAQSARFRMDHRWLLPLGVVETQEFLPHA